MHGSLTELSADLGIGLLQATILFATFAGVLWGLSSGFSFRIGERDYAVPGFMLWAAIIYASAGSLMSYWVGRGLIGRNAERYAREADLRFSLVRVNEHVDAHLARPGRGGREAPHRAPPQQACSPPRGASSGATPISPG